MNERSEAGASSWADPDDAPEMTDEDFARADVYQGGQLVRRGRGRPKADETREQIALRVERRLLERYRDTGPGWQTRMHAALGIVANLNGQIDEMQQSIGAIRRNEVSFYDGSNSRSMNDEHIAHLEQSIGELRRVMDTLSPLGEEQSVHRDKHASAFSAAVGAADVQILANTFSGRVVEMMETDEDAVVGKTSHVIEEVVIQKAAGERVETIHNTMRQDGARASRDSTAKTPDSSRRPV